MIAILSYLMYNYNNSYQFHFYIKDYMRRTMEEFFIEVNNELRKIDKKWLNLHFKIMVTVIVAAFFSELVIGYLMYIMDEISTTIPVYIMKFLVIPSGFNFILGFINYKVLSNKQLEQEKKIYTTSILLTLICFILFTVHSAFTALYFIFALPILLTTIYVDYRLTINTSIISIVGLIVSEIFIKWDLDKESIGADGIRLGNFFISLFVLVMFGAICLLVVRFEKQKNEASMLKEIERYKLQQRIQIDELTGIYNRIGFKNAFQDMEEDKSGNTYIYVMIDIDNFKSLNDNFGHVTGDYCLAEFGRILKNNCEKAIPFRYGGDEFGIIFRNCTIHNVIATCKQIQRDYAMVDFEGKRKPLTISIGIATYAYDMALSTLIIHTDQALYESKKEKNKITIYSNSIMHQEWEEKDV